MKTLALLLLAICCGCASNYALEVKNTTSNTQVTTVRIYDDVENPNNYIAVHTGPLGPNERTLLGFKTTTPFAISAIVIDLSDASPDGWRKVTTTFNKNPGEKLYLQITNTDLKLIPQPKEIAKEERP
jgi:hypothetical protein